MLVRFTNLYIIHDDSYWSNHWISLLYTRHILWEKTSYMRMRIKCEYIEVSHPTKIIPI